MWSSQFFKRKFLGKSNNSISMFENHKSMIDLRLEPGLWVCGNLTEIFDCKFDYYYNINLKSIY